MKIRIIYLLLLSLVSCSDTIKKPVNIEVMQFDWHIGDDLASFRMIPYTYAQITDKGTVYYFINENIARNEFKYSKATVPKVEFHDFIKYFNAQKELSNDASTHATTFAKITFNDNSFETLYISDSESQLIKNLNAYYKKNAFVDTLRIDPKKILRVKFDTISFNRKMKEFIKIVTEEEIIRKRPPPPPNIDSIKYLEQ